VATLSEGNRSEAARGTPLVAHSFCPLKKIVKHSRMTNQAHLLFIFLGVGSDDRAAPGTHDVAITVRVLETFGSTFNPVT
jgi:hypothetical protein